MERIFYEEEAYLRAEKKVKKLKSLYVHLFFYVLINVAISIMKIRRNLLNGETFNEAFFDFNTFVVWLFWGIGLLIHIYSIYGRYFFYSKEWEQRKIQQFMDKDKLND